MTPRKKKAAAPTGLVVELVPIDSLTPDPANARTHDDRNIAAIATSLERFGQTLPLVILADGTVMAGNGTLEAAQSLGWTEVLVTRVPFVSPEEARAFALSDNRSAEMAQWNAPALMQAITELGIDGWSAADLGFQPHDLAAYKPKDAAPPPSFPSYDDDLATDFCCPRCAFEWSGNPE